MDKKRNFTASSILWAVVSVVILALDFAVKQYILHSCRPGEVFGAIPGVADFVYVRNTGAAFSLLSNNTALLSVVSIIFCIAVVLYWIRKKPQHPMLQAALSLLFAGALGNAVDRIAYKFVVDFISIRWFNFPVFNIADIVIVAGAIAAVIYVTFFDKSAPEEKANG